MSLAPGDPDLLFTYAWILLEQGDVEKVEAIISRIPGEWTNQPLWLVIRSRVFTHLTNFEEAQQAAERVIDQEKPRIRALGHYQLGRVLLEKGDTARAATHFQKARDLTPVERSPLLRGRLSHHRRASGKNPVLLEETDPKLISPVIPPSEGSSCGQEKEVIGLHTIWKGSISFGLVNIPVRMYAATDEKRVAFRHLHRPCKTPIRLPGPVPPATERSPGRKWSRGMNMPTGDTS